MTTVQSGVLGRRGGGSAGIRGCLRGKLRCRTLGWKIKKNRGFDRAFYKQGPRRGQAPKFLHRVARRWEIGNARVDEKTGVGVSGRGQMGRLGKDGGRDICLLTVEDSVGVARTDTHKVEREAMTDHSGKLPVGCRGKKVLPRIPAVLMISNLKSLLCRGQRR